MIDGILIDIGQHFLSDLTHLGLGITHRRRAIAIYGTKVTLTVYKHVPKAPFLGHTHHGIIDRRIAMWVIFT